ncbi:MAG: hypothetical protein AAB553_06135 [Patescibacteria group bacterium]
MMQTAAVAKDPKIQTDREVLALQIAQYNRLQLILQKIEEELPLEDALIIEDARQKYLVPTAVAGINAAPNLEALHNIAVKEVEKIVGEDFAELKAIEIISDVEDKVKPEAKEKLLGLEKELAREFEKKMLKLPRDARNRKLQNYAHYSFGDPLRQITSLNQIQDALSDREIILGVESLKEIEMKKLIHRIFTLKDQRSLDDFTDRIMQNPEDLRVLAEMELAINAGRDEAEKATFAQIEENPVVSEIVQEVGGEAFEQVIEQATQEIVQTTIAEQTILEETVTQVQEEIFSAPVNEPSAVEETLPESVEEQIIEIKQEIPTEQVIEVIVSTETTVTVEPVQVSEPVAPVQESAPVIQETAPAPVEQSAPAPQEAAPAPAESAPQTESAPPPAEAPAAPAVEAPAAPVL